MVRNKISVLIAVVRESWIPILLSLIVITSVVLSYEASDTAEPIDAVGVAGSLLLTVFLVYIYIRQNKIMERQQDILEEQQEVQEAAEVEPRLYIDSWRVKNREISIDLENTGEGDAHDLHLLTEIWMVGDDNGRLSSQWKNKIDYHLPSNTEKSYSGPLLFTIESLEETTFQKILRSLRELYSTRQQTPIRSLPSVNGKSFEDLSVDIIRMSREQNGGRAADVEVSINLVYYDSVDREHCMELITEQFSLSEIARLSSSSAKELKINRLRPDFRIQGDIDIFGCEEIIGPRPDSFCFGMQNVGDVKGKIEDLSTVLRIATENGTKSVQEYNNSTGQELNISGTTLQEPTVSCLNPSGSSEFFIPARFKLENEEDVMFHDICDEIIDQGFSNPISIRFRIDYTDQIGKSYQTSRRVIGFRYGDKLVNVDNLWKYTVINKPVSLEKLSNIDGEN